MTFHIRMKLSHLQRGDIVDVSKINLAGQLLNISDTQARADIENMRANVSLIPEISKFQKTADIISNIVIFGDSYVAGKGVLTSEAFPAVLQNLLGDNGKVQAFGLSGVGFVRLQSGYTAATYFESIKSQITNKDDVEAVIVCLGWNDSSQTSGDITAGAISLFQNIKNYMPNAKIIYMPNPGCSCLPRDMVKNVMSATAYSLGVTTIPSHHWMLLQPTLFQSDYVHPTVDGHKRIAAMLMGQLRGQPQTNQAYQTFGNVNVFVFDSMAFLYFGSTNITAASKVTATWPSWMFKGNGTLKPRVNYDSPITSVSTNADAAAWYGWRNSGLDITLYAKTKSDGSLSTGYFSQVVALPVDGLFG